MVYSNNENKVIVDVGALAIAKAPKKLETILGSCIGVALFDKKKKVGGLLHIMLPKCLSKNDKLSKYADTGIPLLVDLMEKRVDSDRNILTAKIFGGANMLNKSNNLFNIGKSNEIMTKEILKSMGIRVIASKLGGTKSHRISLNTETGIVQSRILGRPVEEY